LANSAAMLGRPGSGIGYFSLKPPDNGESRPGSSSMMPSDVQPGHLISLIEAIGGKGGRANTKSLAEVLRIDLGVLSSLVGAAKVLGLVRVEKREIYLTDAALSLTSTSEGMAEVLKGRLSGVEPFRSAIELAMKGKPFTASDVASVLANQSLEWHHLPEINASRIKKLLVDWAIGSNLLKYNGKSGTFEQV